MTSKFSKRDNLCRLAGFLEGEGCISVYTVRFKSKVNKMTYYHYGPRVTVYQAYRKGRYHKYFDIFVKYFGGSIRKGSNKKRTYGKKIVYHYSVRSQKAVKLLKTLLPFLEEKKDRAVLVIRLGKINLSKLENNKKDSARIEKRKLAEEIKRLNHI